MAEKKKHTISVQAAFLLVALALLFDALQAGIDLSHGLPVIGNAFATIATILIDVWAYLSIWFGFKLAAPGISFMRPKRALALNGGLLIELIPILNALPAWTLAVVIIILTTRGEEAIADTLEKTANVVGAAGKMAKAASKIPGMNKNLKQGLENVAERGKETSQFAREKAAQARSLGQQKQLPSGEGAQGQGPQQDELDKLNEKQNLTREDKLKLQQAELIMSGKGWRREQDMQDSVLRAAWEKADRGIRAYDGVHEGGYQFAHVFQQGGMAPPSNPKQSSADIGGQPVFRQPQPSVANAEPQQNQGAAQAFGSQAPAASQAKPEIPKQQPPPPAQGQETQNGQKENPPKMTGDKESGREGISKEIEVTVSLDGKKVANRVIKKEAQEQTPQKEPAAEESSGATPAATPQESSPVPTQTGTTPQSVQNETSAKESSGETSAPSAKEKAPAVEENKQIEAGGESSGDSGNKTPPRMEEGEPAKQPETSVTPNSEGRTDETPDEPGAGQKTETGQSEGSKKASPQPAYGQKEAPAAQNSAKPQRPPAQRSGSPSSANFLRSGGGSLGVPQRTAGRGAENTLDLQRMQKEYKKRIETAVNRGIKKALGEEGGSDERSLSA